MCAGEAKGQPEGPLRPAGGLFLLFLLVNVGLFLAYRVVFLALFVDRVSTGESLRVLLYGLRLDMGFLGVEAVACAFVSALTLALRLRVLWATALFLTALNALLVAADLGFYAERNQHMGELLLANIMDPDHLGSELRSFAVTSPVMATLVVIALVACIWGSIRLVRRIPSLTWSFRAPAKGFLILFPGLLLWGTTSQEISASKHERGYEINWVNARHYSLLNRLPLNEAVANPLQEILVVHLPLAFADVPAARLDPNLALDLTLELLDRTPQRAEFPLLTEIQGREDLELESVVIIQVEGLTASILDHGIGDEWVMPFLRDLAHRGISFPNTVHSYANTAGGVFATVTGMPRTCMGEKPPPKRRRRTRRFPGACRTCAPGSSKDSASLTTTTGPSPETSGSSLSPTSGSAIFSMTGGRRRGSRSSRSMTARF